MELTLKLNNAEVTVSFPDEDNIGVLNNALSILENSFINVRIPSNQ